MEGYTGAAILGHVRLCKPRPAWETRTNSPVWIKISMKSFGELLQFMETTFSAEKSMIRKESVTLEPDFESGVRNPWQLGPGKKRWMVLLYRKSTTKIYRGDKCRVWKGSCGAETVESMAVASLNLETDGEHNSAMPNSFEQVLLAGLDCPFCNSENDFVQYERGNPQG